jgi:flagellar basal-body rod modification protein FlgD
MTVSSISQTGASTSQATDATTSLAKLSENYTAFLKLLTAQLQNQDPLKPMDTKDFTQQLVQFAGVEQSIAVNKNLENLIQLQQAGQTAQATAYIGRTVQVLGDSQELTDGKATWGYKLEGTAAKTDIFIFNSSGTLVHQAVGNTASGEHEFAWDGKDMNGITMPAGEYTMRVSAKDAAGTSVKATTTVNLRVTGVEFTGDGPRLVSGKTQIEMSDIVRVKDWMPFAA